MPLISDATLTRIFNQGEVECSVERPFLTTRISPATVSGVSVVTLPDNCVDILRMTFFGWKMDPLPQRNYRDVFQGQAYSLGQPFWYVYNNIGLQQVQLFPGPNVSLSSVSNPYDPTQIPNGFIVEYFRTSDNLTAILPLWIRQQLLKVYVSKMIYAMEGPSQSLLLAKYFATKWDLKKQEFFTLLDALYGEPRKLVLQQIVNSNFFPGSPVLPITQFGIGVDPQED